MGVGTTKLGIVDLVVAVLTLMAAFFLNFPVAGTGAAVVLGSGFSGLAVLLLVVTVGCSGTSITLLGVGFGFGLVGGVVVAFTTRPPLMT